MTKPDSTPPRVVGRPNACDCSPEKGGTFSQAVDGVLTCSRCGLPATPVLLDEEATPPANCECTQYGGSVLRHGDTCPAAPSSVRDSGGAPSDGTAVIHSFKLPRPFLLIRDVDETGISGTGIVAHGCRFVNGVCTMTWLTKHTSTAVYASVDELRAIHGHGGKTRIVWPFDCCSAALHYQGQLFECMGDPGHRGDHGCEGINWGDDSADSIPPLNFAWGHNDAARLAASSGAPTPDFFERFTSKPCNICGQRPRNYRVDGQLQVVCFQCANPSLTGASTPAGSGMSEEAYRAALEVVASAAELTHVGSAQILANGADAIVDAARRYVETWPASNPHRSTIASRLSAPDNGADSSLLTKGEK